MATLNGGPTRKVRMRPEIPLIEIWNNYYKGKFHTDQFDRWSYIWIEIGKCAYTSPLKLRPDDDIVGDLSYASNVSPIQENLSELFMAVSNGKGADEVITIDDFVRQAI